MAAGPFLPSFGRTGGGAGAGDPAPVFAAPMIGGLLTIAFRS